MINSKNFTIKQETNIETVMAIGKKLKNSLEVEALAQRYLDNAQLWSVSSNGSVQYMIEISEKKIKQFKAYMNGNPEESVQNEVESALKEAGIIS